MPYHPWSTEVEEPVDSRSRRRTEGSNCSGQRASGIVDGRVEDFDGALEVIQYNAETDELAQKSRKKLKELVVENV